MSATRTMRASLTDVSDAWPGAAEVLRALSFQAGFNTSVVVAGTTLLGVAAGIVGVFALLRKRSLMSDALSHATLPGVCGAFLLAWAIGAEGRSLPFLLMGAAVTGVGGALCILLLMRFSRVREDAATGAVLSVFFGAGVVLLSAIQSMSSGNQGGLKGFIYGQTAAMSTGDATMMGVLALVAALAAALLLKEFRLVCFNDEFAAAQGWPVHRIDQCIMALVVVVTVAGLQAVGLILVIAMLIIPAASARFWTERTGVMVVLAGLIGGLSGYAGAVISSLLPRQPTGAVIVLTASALFLVSMLAAPRRGVLAGVVRRSGLRLRIAQDHLLEAMIEDGTDGSAARQVAAMRGWPAWLGPVVIGLLRIRGAAERGEGGGLRLTELGRREGARVARNHRLWEQYLVSYAEVAPSHVDWSVDQVEHVLSDELVRELEAALAARDGGAGMPTRATR